MEKRYPQSSLHIKNLKISIKIVRIYMGLFDFNDDVEKGYICQNNTKY